MVYTPQRTQMCCGGLDDDRAGQGVVQFAQDVDTMCEYAIKFFLDNESFITEANLYAACFPDAHAKVPNDVKARAGALAGLGECDQP